MDRLKIIGIGEIVWDCLPDGRKLGGAPLNFAYFSMQMGADAYAVSAVGNDELGVETMVNVAQTGVNPAFVQKNELPTSRVLVSLDDKGIPKYEIVENVAWDEIACSDRELALASDASVICWGSLAQRSQVSRNSILSMIEASPSSCLKVFDINIRQHFYDKEIIERSLRYADVLKLNEEELPIVCSLVGIEGTFCEGCIMALADRFSLKIVIYTCGASFSEVYDKEGLVSHIRTPKVEVTDTVGAGDSFTAVFVTCLLNGMSVAESHAFAVKVSAWVCTQPGAINPLPEEYR